MTGRPGANLSGVCVKMSSSDKIAGLGIHLKSQSQNKTKKKTFFLVSSLSITEGEVLLDLQDPAD